MWQGEERDVIWISVSSYEFYAFNQLVDKGSVIIGGNEPAI